MHQGCKSWESFGFDKRCAPEWYSSEHKADAEGLTRGRYGKEWRKSALLLEDEAPKAFRTFSKTHQPRDEKVAVSTEAFTTAERHGQSQFGRLAFLLIT